MHTLDYAIVGLYLVAMVVIGLIVTRKASSGIDGFFLGNRDMPWWMLGISGMASNLDITGTMINTALIFALGVQGFFIEIRGGVVLVLAFLMVFMGKWNRRSRVMTQAEWMSYRFGPGVQGDAARSINAVVMLLNTIAMISYFCIGSGKFVAEVLTLSGWWGLPAHFWGALLMIIIAMIYTVASGLYGVIVTDLAQAAIIFVALIAVTVMAMQSGGLPETFFSSVPLRDGTYHAFETTRALWSTPWPNWEFDFPAQSTYSIYNLFGIAVLFYFFRICIVGMSGTSGYMLQRYLAARSDRDAGLLSLWWTFLLSFRWPFIVAVAMLALLHHQSSGAVQDPELALPVVISALVPVGLKGLLVAALMAAAMSTFDSTINAGAAYWVKDLYQAYINPQATERTLLRHGRWASLVVVLLGILVSLTVRSINDIWGWITMSLGSGLLLPDLVRWYWWRLNGAGYACGALFGTLTALLVRLFAPDLPEYLGFLVCSGASLVGMLGATFFTAPTPRPILEHFYRTTRPFGWWRPLADCISTEHRRNVARENRRDLFSLFLAVPWQLALFLMWMMLVLSQWSYFAALLAVVVCLSLGLYFTWYRHLSDGVGSDPAPTIDTSRAQGNP